MSSERWNEASSRQPSSITEDGNSLKAQLVEKLHFEGMIATRKRHTRPEFPRFRNCDRAPYQYCLFQAMETRTDNHVLGVECWSWHFDY